MLCKIITQSKKTKGEKLVSYFLSHLSTQMIWVDDTNNGEVRNALIKILGQVETTDSDTVAIIVTLARQIRTAIDQVELDINQYNFFQNLFNSIRLPVAIAFYINSKSLLSSTEQLVEAEPTFEAITLEEQSESIPSSPSSEG
jgi:hypothetical protein